MSAARGFLVYGTPRPQGSMKALVSRSTGRAFMKYSDTTIEWRRLVTAAVIEQCPGDPFVGPVRLVMTFDLPRPKAHYRTGKRAGELKVSAPVHPSTSPDTDKLARAIGDAITDAGCVWLDDAQVVELLARKRYADGGHVPGVEVKVVELDE